jgi:hypothetical protein
MPAVDGLPSQDRFDIRSCYIARLICMCTAEPAALVESAGCLGQLLLVGQAAVCTARYKVKALQAAYSMGCSSLFILHPGCRMVRSYCSGFQTRMLSQPPSSIKQLRQLLTLR